MLSLVIISTHRAGCGSPNPLSACSEWKQSANVLHDYLIHLADCEKMHAVYLALMSSMTFRRAFHVRSSSRREEPWNLHVSR